MDPPQKRQKSWLSSLLGGRSTTESPSSTNPTEKDHSRSANSTGTTTPSKARVGFAVPSVASPESPVKRASPSLLAQRKIFERPSGPSNKLASSTPKVTNFNSVSTPRTMFRASTRDGPSFAFTPRVPPNTMKESFPPATPGRSFRASTAELTGRGMSKITSSHDLFQMKIPEPDPKLTGEAIAKQVPKDANRTGSIYANEYLAHLCPPEFTDVQRNQFFCILDLRRLKYAADEIFVKKDWKLNILNFAKEYEKSRSLIMLRYGLYEFKSVKVSKEVFDKWKSDNNVPNGEDDAQEEEVAPPRSTAKVNGTAGILRAGKRKAQDELQPKSSLLDSSATTQSKRPRAAEREPLAETTTPALNKSSNKRKADKFDAEPEHAPRAAPAPPKSASRTFLERVANTPRKEPEPAKSNDTPSALKPKATPFAQAAKPATSSLARSVFDSGLKPPAGQAGASSNIFSYLSDASSAKGSGVGGDADGEDTDESDEDESEAQEASQSDEPSVAASGSAATPQPSSQAGAGSIFAPKQPASTNGESSVSSEASEAQTGRSLFDRVNKDSDGQPIRVFPAGSETPRFGSAAPSESGAVAPPEKDAEPAATNKTWNPDTPLKFAAPSSQPQSLFGGASVSKPKESTTPATGFIFGATPAVTKSSEPQAEEAPKPAAPKSIFGTNTSTSAFPANTSSSTTSLFGNSVSKPPAALFGQPKSTEPKPAEEAPKESAVPEPTTQQKSLFGNVNSTAAAKPATPQPPSTNMFGKLATEASTTPAAPQANNLFGSTPKPNGSVFGSTTPAPATSEPAKMPAFGATTSQPASAPAFGFPSATPSAAPSEGQKTPAVEQTSIFGASTTPAPAASQEPKPAAPEPAAQTEPAKSQPSLFGSTAAPSGGIFNFGATSQNAAAPSPAPAASFTFGQEASKPATTPQFGAAANGGGSAGSSFTFTAGGAASAGQSFNNPFATGGPNEGQSSSFTFGSTQPAGESSGTTPFMFGASGAGAGTSTPAAAFTFGGSQQASGTSTPTSNVFGGASTSAAPAPIFNFGGGGGSANAQSGGLFGQQQQPANSGLGFNFGPPMGGTSTGTSKYPRRFGRAQPRRASALI